MLKQYVIFAPHIDDEVIGCYSYLAGGLVTDVYYFYELTPERIEEAKICAELFGFKPHFDEKPKINQNVIILVPSVKDAHPDHKMVYNYAQKFVNEKFYYSVDMTDTPKLLTQSESAKKKEALTSIFKTQADLFNNAKYYLFEQVENTCSKKFIWVTFQREGIHSYPDAPNEVAYLRNPHRHMFHFRVELEVFHNEREIEFIMFKHQLEELYNYGWQLSDKSCETIAEEIEKFILIEHAYSNRAYSITVSEDNENGATIKSYNY
jgi:hypothetical protein